MKNNIIIDKELSIRPVDGFDYFTQHSVGTKYVAAKLDGWVPAADEHLFIAFEKADGSYKIDPIIFGRTVDRIYFTVVPEEVIHDDGEWTMCIYKKLHWNEATGKADFCEVGKKFTFTVMSTIRDDSGNVITQYDLVNIAQFQKDLENGHYAARGMYSWNKDYLYGVGEIIFYPNHGEHGTFLKSITVDNSNAPYVDGELNSAYWEEVVDFNILNGLYDVRDEVTKRAEEAAGSAAAAESSAENAGNSASAAAGSAAESKAAADSVESSAKYLEDIKSGAEAVNKALNDGTGANIAGQFAAVNSDIEGLREDINTESHFRGMFASVEALRAAYPTATPNDYAYIVGGNIYIWENDAWTDSGEPSPNTSVPASNSIPLMDGTGSAGVSSQYARGDHRHPGDTTKASVTSLNAETAARESADTELGTRIDGNETDIAALQSGKVSKSGDTMTGPLNLPQGQQARGYKDANVVFAYDNTCPSGFYSSVFARYDKCFVCGEGEDKAILQYDYNDGWHARVSNNGAEELSVLWMDKNGHLLDNGSRVSLREDRETEQKYAKYINTTPGSSYTKIATVKAEEPSLLTVYGMETSEMGGIIISNEPSLRGGTEWSHTPNADELARVEGEQGYWGKQYLCCTVLIAKGATVYVWGRYITNLYYTLQPVFKKEG